MQRSSVLFPEPERPSSATISPSRRSTEMSSSTGSGLPSGEVNDFDTRVTSMMVAGPAPGPLAGRAAVPVIGYRPGRGAPRRSPSARSQRESRFGQPVQPPPEQPVDDDDERAHDDAPGEEQCEVALAGGTGDVVPEPEGVQGVMAPRDQLGHDPPVPGACRSRDRRP